VGRGDVRRGYRDGYRLLGGRSRRGAGILREDSVVSSPEQFKTAVLEAGKPVLVDFYTDWCGYCRQIAPTIGALSQEYAGKVAFVKVNGDDAGELVRKYVEQGYPTVLVFYGKDKFLRLEGAQGESDYRRALDDAISKYPRSESSPAGG
jgi:thioredoxin 1